MRDSFGGLLLLLFVIARIVAAAGVAAVWQDEKFIVNTALAFHAKMPRMPMIALLLPLLLTITWSAQAQARALQTDPVTEPSLEGPRTEAAIGPDEEETTYSGSLEMNTVTISVDADAIMTTDDGVQMFTSLPAFTTTEEPLPDSVVQQLEQERAERDGRLTTKAPTTTEEVETTTVAPTNATTRATTTPTTINTTTQPATTTTQAATTTTAAIAMTTVQPEPVTEHAAPEKSQSLLNPKSTISRLVEESQEMNLESLSSIGDVAGYMTTEQTAMIAEEAESYGSEQTTNVPLMDFNTSGSFSLDAMASGTESSLVEQSTFMESMSARVESTTEMDTMRFMTTQPPEADYEPHAEVITEASHSNSTTERNIMHLLSRLSLNTITQRPGSEPEAKFITTEESVMQTTLTTASADVGSTTEPGTESTLAPPKQQSLFQAVPMQGTTEAAAASSTDAPLTSSTTSTTTTTKPTTELITKATRAPRIERIFNSDGVEVLYGYSSVNRS
ncbi:PREDICTED: mucin-5AC [Drosophila arizonae]|uniref:Mucin-5AC n=1 Tax=Drosophila arizonae TaxID=7263 RepID=A0ABM1NZY4_DROAR|nr:PREDICTED: mucin-5AC [Drosophila arizonae]